MSSLYVSKYRWAACRAKLIRMLASAVMPATAQIMLLARKACQQRPGAVRGFATALLIEDVQLLGRRVLLQQLGRDLPLRSQDDAVLARMPIAVPACEMASRAYSTW